MGSGGTEAGTRGVKIPHHQFPTGENECARATARSIGEERLGLFLHTPMAVIGAVLVNSKTVTEYGFLLGSLINYRTRNRSADGVGAIGVWYLVSDLSGFRQSPYLRDPPCGYHLDYECYNLFSPSCRGSECSEQALVTSAALADLDCVFRSELGLGLHSGRKTLK
jgi:hypothetical protein